MENSEFLRSVASAYARHQAWPAGDVAGCNGSSHGIPFEGILFVFPNRRSMKFFQKYLGEEFGKVYNRPLFSPQMLTISELFNKISGISTVDPIEAQYILYRNYIALKYPDEPLERASERESFDEFIHWGSLIISDFNDIDKYLIDAKQLFTNIKDLKQLDSDYSFLSESQRRAVEMFWRNFLKGETSFKKESFTSLWDIMYPLYLHFKEDLESRGVGYEGMIYRKVAENPNDCGYDRLVFIGFNAPNKCEQTLMKWLKERGKGDFYWDFYGPMVTDKDNKASIFIGEASREFPGQYDISSEYAMPQIHTVGVSSSVGQAFVVADILKTLEGEDPIKTAVILPDETLLMPVLNSIPASFDKINVTMGFPISATPLVSFVNSIASLQKGIRMKDGIGRFYHGDIAALLRHEYIKEHAGSDATFIMRELICENRIYLASDSDILEQLDSPLLKSVFKVTESAAGLLEYLENILKELDLVADTLNKEFIYRYYLEISRLKALDVPMKRETCLRLLLQITSSITIPFKGEPLAGLQVIGSLEVRALDFDNVIILSVNEGEFPASAQNNSLIPYNLRVGFGLPTYELHDAIAAYHFYRSIYRAKNVWLIYDTRAEGVKSGEVSRFVKQLEFHYNADIKKSVVSSVPQFDEAGSAISVQKSEEVMAKLYDAFVSDKSYKTLSASAINTYLACPLQFYWQYVEGIREEEEVEESIEASTFGTIFHDTMEELYKPYLGEIVSEELLERMIADCARIENVIGEQFAKNRIREIIGRNIIIKEVIKKYVLITLQEDKKYAPFTYMAGEETFYNKMELPGGLKVKFKAVIDRIDDVAGSLRVIDYKTGGVELPGKNMEIGDLFLRDTGKHYKAFVQLYLYALILGNIAGENGVIELKNGKSVRIGFSDDSSNLDLVVYPVTSLKKGSIVSEPIYKSNLDKYKDALLECVTEIFDKDVPFGQATEGSDVCGYCMFKHVCGR